MAFIRVKDAVVEFPIYGGVRSIRKVIVRAATGGLLKRDASERVVVRALDSVSFEFHEGDRVGLVGHNGSGKSTLLRLLAGIYEPTEGSVEINGRVSSMLNIYLGMNMDATGFENIYMRGRVMGVPLRKMRLIIDDIAEFTGLGDYLNLPLRTYSSGMAMRLGFAVSTSIEADIILMDEWLSVGDAEFSQRAKLRLDNVMSEARIIIVASHNQQLIESQCNKIIRLEHGKIIQFSQANAVGKFD
jgi:lipopolysaccharide transport system ATP-binding protein